jgi:DNA-binding NtrC family response regulator
LEADHKRLVNSSGSADELIGESEPIQEMKTAISRIARATGCVLIRGESGAGKELVARALHRASPRSDRPLLSVNCAAIPPNLIESQLFGHMKGAFTGASADHLGWFKQADSGTLFLDEVGELPLIAQAKLLRILEGHPFLPVGATREVSVDVRVIAATNRDLRQLVNSKAFREDLFYRLTVFEIEVPPLRHRGDDVALLVDHFLERFRNHHGRPALKLAAAAREKLLAYRWPGNVRQLRNVIDSCVVMAEGDSIEPGDLGLQEHDAEAFDSLRIEHWERKLIQKALKETNGKVPEAATLLGISRATLYRKLDEFGIERKS